MLRATEAAQIVGIKVHTYSMVGNTIPQGAVNYMTLDKAFATGKLLIDHFLNGTKNAWLPISPLNHCKSSNQEIFAVQMSP